jgi:non-haem Fe2+, alpha-ketoglutarate-dependent halogenase
MPKLLTDAQIEQYHSRGYVCPFRALDPAAAAAARREIEAFEATVGDEAQKFLSYKAHLPLRFLADIIRNPRILDAVEDVLGPNLLCWGSSFFQKNAHDPRFISWHQDSYYYGMEPSNTCTAWLAFSTSDEVSGSVRVIPGSHVRQMEFVNTPTQHNLLGRGQTILGVDESKAVHMNLAPGEFSLHHEGIVHNSEPNRSDDRRIGLSIHYIPTSTRQVKYVAPGRKPLATLVRGVDEFSYWDPEPVTELDYDPAMLDKLMQMRREFLTRER